MEFRLCNNDFMRLNPAIRTSSWLVMLAFSLLLAGMTFRYYSFRPDIHFLHAKQWIVNDIVWRIAFYIHITGGILAIALGPFQFLKISRTKFKPVHRTLGKIYLVAILCIAAPSGFYMAQFAEGGPWATAGFSVMAMLWFYTTWIAYSAVRERRFAEHRNWMRRSYALTFSAVTLRIWVPVASLIFGIHPRAVIVLSAWVSWAINLALVELFSYFDQSAKRNRIAEKLLHEKHKFTLHSNYSPAKTT